MKLGGDLLRVVALVAAWRRRSRASTAPLRRKSSAGERREYPSARRLGARRNHCGWRVTPARSSVFAALRPSKALTIVDFPEFGTPTIIAREMPAAGRWSAEARDRDGDARRRFARTRPSTATAGEPLRREQRGAILWSLRDRRDLRGRARRRERAWPPAHRAADCARCAGCARRRPRRRCRRAQVLPDLAQPPSPCGPDTTERVAPVRALTH